MSKFSRTYDEKKMIERLNKIYGLGPKVLECSKIINGHINDTYNVVIEDEDGKHQSYVFQRVNDHVFSEPVKIMNNLKIINSWLEKNGKKSSCGILTFLKTAVGTNYIKQPRGGFWRVSKLVENSKVFDQITDKNIMRNTGRAFGEFQLQLAGIPLEDFEETIPDFHNTPKRIKTLFEIVKKDPVARAEECKEDIAFFEKNCGYFSTLETLRLEKKIPERVTHNDTKCNNILFDKTTLEPVMIIDLDTIMPGLAAYDYGDAIRCSANYAQEDETDLKKVGLNMHYFEAFTEGFVTAAKTMLTPNEEKYLALGAPTIAFELASRFLADYLDGDKYFKIGHPEHNLERARCQIQLCKDMMRRYDKMCAVVDKYYL